MFKFTQQSEEYKFMVTWWKWLQDHYEPDQTDDYWDDVIKSGSAVAGEYKGTDLEEFAIEIVMASLNHLERKCKK